MEQVNRPEKNSAEKRGKENLSQTHTLIQILIWVAVVDITRRPMGSNPAPPPVAERLQLGDIGLLRIFPITQFKMLPVWPDLYDQSHLDHLGKKQH